MTVAAVADNLRASDIFTLHKTCNNQLNLANKTARLRINRILARTDLTQLSPRGAELIGRLTELRDAEGKRKAERKSEIRKIELWKTIVHIATIAGVVVTIFLAIFSPLIPGMQSASALNTQIFPSAILIGTNAYGYYSSETQKGRTDAEMRDKEYGIRNAMAAALLELEPHLDAAEAALITN